MRSLAVILTLTAALAVLAACSTPPYASDRSRTAAFGDQVFRYGSMGAGGAGGYFLGDSLGDGDPMVSGLGAAGGVGAMYALHKVYDDKQMDAYAKGISVGMQQGREEVVNEMWKREAVYGLPPEDSEGGYYSGRAPIVRNVYAPSRTVNGVNYQGGYQQVFVSP